MKNRCFQFGPFHLDPADQLLLREGKPLSLAPKAFETLLYLVENPHRLVTREELIKAIWPNSFVEDGSLSVNISLIRRTLGDMRGGGPYIETVPRKGYRFLSDVRVLATEEQSVPLFAASTRSSSSQLASPAALGLRELSTSLVAPGEPSITPPPRAAPLAPLLIRRSKALAGVATVLLLLGWATFVILKRREIPPFASMSISRLTWRGDAVGAAISPDGKYVAYLLNEARGQSLWIRQVDAPGNIRLLAPEHAKYSNLTFSPDGNFLYYTKAAEDHLQVLYRIPVLGGDQIKLLARLSGPLSFSPDAKQFAFLRVDPVAWDASLMVANADGSGLRRITRRTRPRYFSPLGLAWLPDGRAIVCFAGDAAGYGSHAFHLIKVNVSDGVEEAVTSHTWSWAGPIASSVDGRSLLIAASEQAEDALQIWRVSQPGGQASRVTNDLNNYIQLSSSSDGKTLAAVQVDKAADLWIASADDLAAATPLPAGNIHGLNDLTWTPDGLIAYSARSGDYFRIFLLDKEGQLSKQLTTEPGDKTEIAVTPDGRYLLYQSDAKIWRMNRDGSAPLQLSFGSHDVHPEPSPDSRSVLYASFAKWSPAIGGKPILWSVPIDGGHPTQLTTLATSLPQFSPDGKWIAAAYFPRDDPRFSEEKIALFSRTGGSPIKIFARGSSADDRIYWSPDGKGIDYTATHAGAANIWRQSLLGGPPLQLTRFTSDQIFDFAWSCGGKRLALARGKSVSDVVLIRNSE